MLGILGDALLIALGVPLLALLTYKLWAPAFRRLLRDIRRDIDDVEKES